MYTIESLQKQFEVGHEECLKDPRFKDETKPLFNRDGSFNRKNWNSNQADIRSRLEKSNIVWPGNDLHIEYTHDQEDEYAPISITYIHSLITFNSDQWHIIINVINDEGETYDSYVVTWYKSRGCTEMITKNGNPITIEQYVSLLNDLETMGFFESANWK